MGKVTNVAIYICAGCGQEIDPPAQGDITTRYGIMRDGAKVCYPCCGLRDRAAMIADGRAILYLTNKPNPSYTGLGTGTNRQPKLWFVTNWPNSLTFTALGSPSESWHNIARVRLDVWFYGPDGFIWHAVQYGRNTQILRCKRTKRTNPHPVNASLIGKISRGYPHD